MSFVLLEDDFIAAFYHTGNDNVFEIVEYPYCLTFSLCMYNNTDSENLNFGKYLSISENNGRALKMYFIELTDSSIGFLKFSSNHSIIKENIPYDIEELYFHSNAITGTFTIKFAGVNYNNNIGRTCELIITIKPCVEYCFSCLVYNGAIVNVTFSKKEFEKDLKKYITDYAKNNLIIKGSDFILQTYSLSFPPLEREELSSIELSQCELVLKREYSISEIYIAIFDYNDTVDYHLYDINGKSLDISICEEIPITISKKINSSSFDLSEGLYYQSKGINIYNIKDNYYTDICYHEIDDKITLEERLIYIFSIVEKFNLCDSSCVLIDVNYRSHKAKCECNTSYLAKIQYSSSIFKMYFSKTCVKKLLGKI